MALAGTALLLLYFTAFSVLAFFALHRVSLLLLLRRRSLPPPAFPAPLQLPRVTVQLPIYNEQFVVERLLAAVARMDYPRALLDVQVLDDSTDGTRALIGARVAAMRGRGLAITHLTRATRTGFKAGALANALPHARGEFVLILDADFLPQPSLIHDLLPPLADPRIAVVQARWGHLNREQNRLTRVQALLLDAHFLLETAARAHAGLFFNFHGTAGLWRKSAIESVGGWSADTLTEDLDLSYRAQLAGWKFAYLPDVVVPAELPATLAAFRQQQARWAEGTIATARKHMRALINTPMAMRTRVEAIIHLTCHCIYPATLIVALTALPVMLYRAAAGPTWLFWADLFLALAVIVPTRIFYRTAARAAGTRPPGLRQMPHLMLTGIALSISNTRAVMVGTCLKGRAFERTPKAGASGTEALVYRVKPSSIMRSLDGSVAAYLTVAAGIALGHGLVGAVPAFVFLAYAFGIAAVKG